MEFVVDEVALRLLGFEPMTSNMEFMVDKAALRLLGFEPMPGNIEFVEDKAALRLLGFEPMPGNMEFVVDKVALRHIFSTSFAISLDTSSSGARGHQVHKVSTQPVGVLVACLQRLYRPVLQATEQTINMR
jgi:hypothetical protein